MAANFHSTARQEAWAALRKRAMEKDFSWHRSALRYMEIFNWAKVGRPALPLSLSLSPSLPPSLSLARLLAYSPPLSRARVCAHSTSDPDLPSLVSLFCARALPLSLTLCLSALSLRLHLPLPDGCPVREPGPLLRSGELDRGGGERKEKT